MKSFDQIYQDSLQMFNSEYHALRHAVMAFTKQHVKEALHIKSNSPHLDNNEVYPLSNIEKTIYKTPPSTL
jgi:hypothetical protein